MGTAKSHSVEAPDWPSQNTPAMPALPSLMTENGHRLISASENAEACRVFDRDTKV